MLVTTIKFTADVYIYVCLVQFEILRISTAPLCLLTQIVVMKSPSVGTVESSKDGFFGVNLDDGTATVVETTMITDSSP